MSESGSDLDGSLGAGEGAADVAELEVATREHHVEARAQVLLGRLVDELRSDEVVAAADDALGRVVDDLERSVPVAGRPVVVGRDPPVERLGVERHGPMQGPDRLDAEVPRQPGLEEFADERVVSKLPALALARGDSSVTRSAAAVRRAVSDASIPLATSARSGVTIWRIEVRIRNACRSGARSPTTSSAR